MKPDRKQMRRGGCYFEREPGAPAPIAVRVTHRVCFGEVDPMAIVWHGNYPRLFELASAELGRLCGLGYGDFFAANLRAPIIKLHIDYLHPLRLDEEVSILARLVWCEGARINTEFELTRPDGLPAATGFTLQLFTDGATDEPVLVTPPMLQHCRARWQAGEFAHLQ